jgi:hypothetical protein
MNSFEVSKRVALAVNEVNKANDNKKLSYDKIADKIEAIASKYKLSMDYIRKVSGVEFTNISNLIKYYKNESEKQFTDNYVKLSKTDKARVDLAITNIKEKLISDEFEFSLN